MLWSLFSAGGVLSALVAPGLILIFLILAPLGVFPAEATSSAHLAKLFHPLPVRLAFLVVCTLTFIHWAHRFRFAVYDLGFKAARGAVAVLCYGMAVAGSLWAASVLLRIG